MESSGVEQTLQDYQIRGGSLLVVKEAAWIPQNDTRIKYSTLLGVNSLGRGHTGRTRLVASNQADIASDG
jgi:hypothetical protein